MNEKPGAPSGRLNLKVPRSLHADLKQRAAAERVSLNQLVVMLLAQGLSMNGRRSEIEPNENPEQAAEATA